MSKKLLFEINEEAEKYYQSHISSEEGKKAIVFYRIQYRRGGRLHEGS